MIYEFGCKNIKAIKDFEAINVKPITIIMGENSSGKSSILESLSLLSVNKIFQGNEFIRINYNNPFSKWGNVNEFKNKKEQVELAFSVIDESNIKHNIQFMYIDDVNNEHYGILERIVIESDNSNLIILRLINDNDFSISLGDLIDNNISIFRKEILEVKDEIFINTNLRILTSIFSDENNKIFLSEIFASFSQLNDILLKKIYPLEILSENLKSIRHVGHIQKIPASYDYQGDYIGYFGEVYQKVAQGLNLESNKYLIDSIEKIFNYKSEINEDTGVFHFFEDKKKLPINMFGSSISSTVPILTQISKNREYKDEYRLTIIEEPEQNLHPLAQSKFVETIFSDYKDFNHNYIIETHSEHLLNKLRHMVFKKQIDADDIVVYYKSRNKKFSEILIDEKGLYLNSKKEKIKFPKGFFDATLDEIFEIETNNL